MDKRRRFSIFPDSIEQALNDSLKRLKTDYIDLYQLHWPERNTNYFGDLDYEHDEKEKIGIVLKVF